MTSLNYCFLLHGLFLSGYLFFPSFFPLIFTIIHRSYSDHHMAADFYILEIKNSDVPCCSYSIGDISLQTSGCGVNFYFSSSQICLIPHPDMRRLHYGANELGLKLKLVYFFQSHFCSFNISLPTSQCHRPSRRLDAFQLFFQQWFCWQ